MRRMMKLLRTIVVGLVILVLGGAAALYVAHRVADGPIGPISGGVLRKGELVTDPNVDWTAALAGTHYLELQLEVPPESRTTAFLIQDGQLYIPADMGFLQNRMPSAPMRMMGSVITAVKHWPKDAERDGRAVIRAGGKRYERKVVRVTDPALEASLRATVEQGAARTFGPKMLETPGDPALIWFFRVEPR
jgi:hypothetical protein